MSFSTWNRQRTVLTVFTLIVGLVGCSSGSSSILDTNPGDSISADLPAVAVKADELTQRAIAGPLAEVQGTPPLTGSDPERPASIDSSLQSAMACPAGGEIVVSGMFSGNFDRDTRMLEIIGSGERTAIDCIFDRGERLLTINGSSSWELVRRWVYGAPDGLQTRRYFGSWTVSSDEGQSRTCTFDYTLAFDPATGSISAEGQMCNAPIPGGLRWMKDIGA